MTVTMLDAPAPPSDSAVNLTRRVGPEPSWRALAAPTFLWWATTAIASVAMSTPTLVWFDALSQTPFESLPNDLSLLYERLSNGASAAWLLPLGPIVQAVLVQVLLWRLLVSAPMALTMATLSLAPSARLRARAIARMLRALPRFILMSLVVQCAALVIAGLGLRYAIHLFLASDAGPLAFALGSIVACLTLLTLATCFTWLELSRLTLFSRPLPQFARSSGGLGGLVDGAEVLLRWRTRGLATFVACWGVGTAAGVTTAALAGYASVHHPESLGLGLSWAIAQVGVLFALVARVTAWRRALRWINERAPG